MTFSNTKNIIERDNNVCIDDIKMYTVNKIKYLGLLINNTLNWSAYNTYICNKILLNLYYFAYLPVV